MAVGRLCIKCGKAYYTKKPRCAACEKKRSADRPWYKMEVYRRAQSRARSMVGKECPRCYHRMEGDRSPSVDHITPISMGGSWYGPFEIVCIKCNVRKGGKVW